MAQEFIEVIGAREHNLKNINVRIPKGKMVVFSGVSGSGKSSLAFDTIYAEGQRRYVESLSAYARQFLGQMEKPLYDAIHGLTPTIAIEQKSASANPRSTVGTITEIHDYLRVLFARVGEQFCYKCNRPVAKQEPTQIVHDIMKLYHDALSANPKITILAPLVRNRKGEFRDVLENLRIDGFTKVVIDGVITDLSEIVSLDKNKKHDIDVVIDRIVLKQGVEPRLTDSVETGLKVGKGVITVRFETGETKTWSEHLACEQCGISFPELSPQLFSFNNPIGACPACAGLGTALSVDVNKLVPDPSLSIREGAIEPLAKGYNGDPTLNENMLLSISKIHGIDLDRPFKDLPETHKALLLYGDNAMMPIEWRSKTFSVSGMFRFEGIANTILRRFKETKSEEMRLYYQHFLEDKPCESCLGKRLRPESLSVKVCGFSIADLSDMPISKLLSVFKELEVEGSKAVVVAEIKKEIISRLQLLVNLGIGYLTLSRTGGSLSGGEAQRIRLASQLGSELTGVTYVLDEPSIGLHPRDNGMLIDTLKRLRDLGNTVIIVEHDRDAILGSDYVIDFGPGAGKKGGEIVFEGTPKDLMLNKDSLTGAYLSGRMKIHKPHTRRKPKGFLKLIGPKGNNLKGETILFPLGTFIVVTGVSGAGKSSLVTETLSKALQKILQGAKLNPLPYDGIEGIEHLDKIVVIDQQPIGRTPRSNPATYTKCLDLIRVLFANTREAKVYGYSPGRFSFNVKGGRCERCQGAGIIRVEMHFMPDMFVTCEECKGKRFNESTLRVKYKDLTISDVLNLTVDEAQEVFANHKNISRILKTLQDVGLGYITLGQPSPTLSGGEAQRIKLSRELSKVSSGKTLYIMDEPSTGLHFDDIAKLLRIIHRLVDMGNTVIMVEHNLDIIGSADYVIDLGPEGGDEGGYVVACGTPEEVASSHKSHTGRLLRSYLNEESYLKRGVI